MELQPRVEPNRQQLEDALLRRIDDWRGVLRSNPVQGRIVVQQLFGEIQCINGGRPSESHSTVFLSGAETGFSGVAGQTAIVTRPFATSWRSDHARK